MDQYRDRCCSFAEGGYLIVTGQSVVDWMIANSDEFRSRDAVGIGWHDGKRLVAGVAYNEFNPVNVCMHVVAIPGKRWLNRRFLWACFDYPFNYCKVNRVTGVVAEGNEQARKFDEHLGFTLEATLQDAHPTGNLLVYRMLRSECKWISRDFSRRYAKAA